MKYLIILIFIGSVIEMSAQEWQTNDIGFDQEKVLDKLNKLRSQGCDCGRKYMKPASPVFWNKKLVESANIQAKMMRKYRYFGHVGPDGKNVADKMDEVNYPWQFAGENLGEGQRSFMEVLRDWIDSPTHCELLLDPRMQHIGLVKSSKYWVLHMGKELPRGAKRTRERYVERQ